MASRSKSSWSGLLFWFLAMLHIAGAAQVSTLARHHIDGAAEGFPWTAKLGRRKTGAGKSG